LGLLAWLILTALPAVGSPVPGLSSNRQTAVNDFHPNPHQVLIDDSLTRPTPQLIPVCLNGSGASSFQQGRLELQTTQPDALYAVCHPHPVSGHFYAEVSYDRDQDAGLVLVADKDGRPDPANFTSICVETGADGKVSVFVRDRQNGRDNVLDCQGSQWWRKRYRLTLDNQYSVGVAKTAGRFRIFRDAPAGLFHFYVQIRKLIAGEWCTGWVELSPSPDWGDPERSFFVGMLVHGGPAHAAFSNLQVVQEPVLDRSDVGAGFRVTRRDFHWSGFWGEGLVVTFGPEFPFARQDRKLVFWSSALYVPAWRLSDQLLQIYEFIETWDGGAKGCFEPMSDRMLRYSHVDVMEDDAVRKVIRWQYALINPDYIPWGQPGGGKQIPHAEEWWIVYPDGMVVRRQRYWPCLDSSFQQHPLGNEVCELDPIYGSLSEPGDVLGNPTISVMNLGHDQLDYSWPGKDGDFSPEPSTWKVAILAVHYRDPGMPDAFTAFAQDPSVPGTFANPPMAVTSTWHRKQWWRFSHFPVSLEPYMWDTNSQIEGRGQVSHTSLVNVGAPADRDWKTDFKIDASGRKYRDWVSLVGLSPQKDPAALRQSVASWLYGGQISRPVGCKFVAYSPSDMEHRVTLDAGRRACSFDIGPSVQAFALAHPVLRVDGWPGGAPHIGLAGQVLESHKDFRWSVSGHTLFVWLDRVVKQPVQLNLAAR
jgi:hypothetical protein